MHDSESQRSSDSAARGPVSASPSVGEALVLGSALAKPFKSAGERKGLPDRVTVRQRQRNGRRGVILVFVVVLLTLLGIMGTAYLASSRLDRQAIIGRGSLTGTSTALLKDTTTLDKLQSGVEQAAEQAMIRDLFNVAPKTPITDDAFKVSAFNQFRQTLSTPTIPVSWYRNYDAPGRADPWLSSLLPTRQSSTNASPVWPWISGPLLTPTDNTVAPPTVITLPGTSAQADPFFSDPRYMAIGGPLAANQYAKVDTTEVYPAQNVASQNPLTNDDVAVTSRHNVPIGYQPMNRTTNADNVRMYPAIVLPGPGGALTVALAGDADGDGIADSALQPIRINPTATGNVINQYLDTTNNVIYYAAYRIVDNSAKLNLATALDVRGDLAELAISPSTTEGGDSGKHSPSDSPYGSVSSVSNTTPEVREYLTEDPNALNTTPTPTGNTTPADGTVGPNFGFFRANVGLTGVLRQLMTPMNQVSDTNDSNRVPFQQDLRRLIDLRFPLLKQNPGTAAGNQASVGYYQQPMTDNKDIQSLATTFGAAALAQMKLGTVDTNSMAGAQLAPYPLQYHYRSIGDLLEQQVARRYGSPGGYLWTNATTPAVMPTIPTNSLTMLGFGDTASLSAKGGALANDLVSPGSAEQGLLFSMRSSTPNVNNNGDAPWGWFPPNAVGLWFGWTQDFDVDPTTASVSAFQYPIRALDATNANDRAFSYVVANDPNKPNGTADVVLQRSPRVLFTTYNGTTTTTPKRGDQNVPGSIGNVVTQGLPIGMPAYSAFDARDGQTAIGHKAALPNSAIGRDPYLAGTPATYFSYPNVKVSAATGTKEQLWRGYWSAMTQQVPFNYVFAGQARQVSFWDAARKNTASTWGLAGYDPNNFYDAFRAPDRYSSDESAAAAVDDPNLGYLPNTPYDERQRPTQVMSTRQMALIRSAVAACNTVDLRDNDNDITAMDVDVTDDNTNAVTRYYARVFGTEKQLVISGVFVYNAATPFVAVEIYNPTDIPIQLSAYHLAMMTRSGGQDKTTGILDVVNATTPIRLSTSNTAFVQPGGYVVVYSNATVPGAANFVGPAVPSSTPTHPISGTPDTYVITPATHDGDGVAAPGATDLTQLATGAYELVLARTRRADGHPFTDLTATPAGGVRDGIENEIANDVAATEDTVTPNSTTDVRTLVTLDAVDARFGGPAVGARYIYQRQRPAPPQVLLTSTNSTPLSGPEANPQQYAWRCFYAGQFYALRPAAGARTAAVATPASVTSLAWETAGTTAVNFGPLVTTALGPPPWSATTATVLAPAIPIQNFRPFDPYTESNSRPVTTTPGTLSGPNTTYGLNGASGYFNAISGPPGVTLRGLIHLVSEFPYGSPFAREMDLQDVPFIGTYKIYRAAGGAPTLYEAVPLTMDAVNVGPDPTALTTGTPEEVLTLGRFDPRPDSLATYPNAWAANLTDFVTARHAPYLTYFPDVAATSLATTFYNTQTINGVAPTSDQRYAQDGPVTGNNLNVNTFADVNYVSFVERAGTGTDTTMVAAVRNGLRTGVETGTGASSSLTQGVINVNTAPQIVLRQLPWVVDTTTGQVDFTQGSVGDNQIRTTVNRIVADPALGRDMQAAAAWPGPTAAVAETFGFASLASLIDRNTGISDIAINGVNSTGTVASPQTAVPIDLLRLGLLNPMNQNEAAANYQLGQVNLARVSNLLTTRSDVYTVYVTVQAWTWAGGVAGGNQQTDTRLVGERRSSFVVDRSKIDPDHFDLSNLIVLPIERE